MIQDDGFAVFGPSTEAITRFFVRVVIFLIDKTDTRVFCEIDGASGIKIIDPDICISPIGKVFTVR